MKKRKRRVYVGEFEAIALCHWLNDNRRPAGDPVEQLLALSGQLNTPLGDAAEEIRALVGRLVSISGWAMAPAVGDITVQGWEIAWRPVGDMDPTQGLALAKLLRLAEIGLLSRVRQCAWEKCGKWYFAHFKHQEFCSDRCQHSTREWKDKRAALAKRNRQTAKNKPQRNWTKEDDEGLSKRHPRFAVDIKKKRWHG